MVTTVVKDDESNQTLEKYIKKVLNRAPLSFIYKLFRKKDIRVNGHWQNEKFVLSTNDEVSIYVTDEQYKQFHCVDKISPSDKISSWIVYEDNNILIINKPRGILVQANEKEGIALDKMVISYLAYKKEYDISSNTTKPAPVHRIDRNTAGLVIFGKNIKTLQCLMQMMQDKSKVTKSYLVLVKGAVKEKGIVDAPLLKIEKTSTVKVCAIEDGGKKAKTLYKPIKNINDYSLLEVTLLTGRTHQIRVHMAYINHPVIGDSKYGDFQLNKNLEKLCGFKNQFLMANKIQFGNIDGHLNYLANKTFEIQLNDEFKNLLNFIENNHLG